MDIAQTLPRLHRELWHRLLRVQHQFILRVFVEYGGQARALVERFERHQCK